MTYIFYSFDNSSQHPISVCFVTTNLLCSDSCLKNVMHIVTYIKRFSIQISRNVSVLTQW